MNSLMERLVKKQYSRRKITEINRETNSLINEFLSL